MKILYHGVWRLVEPYSLTYKTTKDGASREYFYGYDQTGGQTSGPSIKSFLHQSIRAIEQTDKKFTPRFEIELSKAVKHGEIVDFEVDEFDSLGAELLFLQGNVDQAAANAARL